MSALNYWDPQKLDDSNYKNKLIERINNKLKLTGGDETGLCTYSYNELGFRGDSINKNGFKIMSIGCSLTEGIGVNDFETWPHYFSNLIQNGVDYNFGYAGRSNDYISRMLISYYDIIKPDLVLIMYTFPHRRESYHPNCNLEPFVPTKELRFANEERKIHELMLELQNSHEDLNNWYRNHLLIKYFLKSKKCNWIWNGTNIKNDYTEFNRFDGDFGGPDKFLDKGVDNVHPGPKHYKQYARVLFDYISLKFPSYIPNNNYKIL